MTKYVIRKKNTSIYWGGNADFGTLDLQTRNFSVPTSQSFLYSGDSISWHGNRPVIPFCFDTSESAQKAINYVPRDIEVEIVKVNILIEVEES